MLIIGLTGLDDNIHTNTHGALRLLFLLQLVTIPYILIIAVSSFHSCGHQGSIRAVVASNYGAVTYFRGLCQPNAASHRDHSDGSKDCESRNGKLNYIGLCLNVDSSRPALHAPYLNPVVDDPYLQNRRECLGNILKRLLQGLDVDTGCPIQRDQGTRSCVILCTNPPN